MRPSAWPAALAAAALLPALLAAPAGAAAPDPLVVTFTGETSGAKPNGYSSAETSSVLFYDTVGANLFVGDFGPQSNGVGLLAGSDFDDSALEIRLTSPTTGISLAFGNDDPFYLNATDQAALTLYRNATQVGYVTVNVNANDVMDQTIGYQGRVFNRATLQYVDAAGAPVDLSELVDDVVVQPLCTLAGDDRDNRLRGTDGPDVICGDTGDDTIESAGGDDLVYPGGGDDTTSAGAGDDTVIDGGGDDVVAGGAGADDVRGGSGDDTVKGGGGKDRLNGGPGRDRLDGGPARDRCDGGLGRDTARSCEQRNRIP